MTFWLFCLQYFDDRLQIILEDEIQRTKNLCPPRQKYIPVKKNVLLETSKSNPHEMQRISRLSRNANFFPFNPSFVEERWGVQPPPGQRLEYLQNGLEFSHEISAVLIKFPKNIS